MDRNASGVARAGMLALTMLLVALFAAVAATGPATSVGAMPAEGTETSAPGATATAPPPTETDAPASTATEAQPTAAGGAAAIPTATPFDVLFTPDGLRPPIVAVPVGSTIRWTNATNMIHNTTHLPELGAPALWSADLAPGGEPFTVTFTVIGTYPYIDNRFPDDLDFQGRVVVTRNDPTATPLTPTAGPSPTDGPTATPRDATATVPPTPTRPEPTRVPVVLLGRLVQNDDPLRPCGIDARLYLCDYPSQSVLVRADGMLSPLFGYDVRLEGVMEDCPTNGSRYLWVSQAQPLPGGCGGATATATPPPTPTVRPTMSPSRNLALGRPVTAKRELGGFEAARATDGDPNTTWYTSDAVSWVYVDLGEVKTFNQVRFRWAEPYAGQYGIYVSQGGAWTGVFLADNARGGEDVRNLAYTEARYVLLYMMRSSADSGGYALGEFEIYGEERPNWALGQAVFVSSALSEPPRPGANATDGALDTWWVSAPGDPNPWLYVYLPTSVQLIEFKLHWTTWYPRLYSLVFFEGGRATFSAPVRSTTGGLHHFRGQVPVRADTLMVYTHENAPGGQIGLEEIELYAPGPGLEEVPATGRLLELHDLRNGPAPLLDAFDLGPGARAIGRYPLGRGR